MKRWFRRVVKAGSRGVPTNLAAIAIIFALTLLVSVQHAGAANSTGDTGGGTPNLLTRTPTTTATKVHLGSPTPTSTRTSRATPTATVSATPSPTFTATSMATLTFTTTGTSTPTPTNSPTVTLTPTATGTTTTPIQHVVIIMQENHAFDSLFGRFPGADGATLPAATNPMPDIDHDYAALHAQLDGGMLDEFPLNHKVQYSQSDIPTYWAYAQHFSLGDNFFSSIATDSQANHMAMIAAQNVGEMSNAYTCGGVNNSLMYSVTAQGVINWTYPCYTAQTLPQRLSTTGLSWKYYGGGMTVYDPLLNISGLASSPNDNETGNGFLSDVASGNLPAVSWIVPGNTQSDHPPYPLQQGQNFVAAQVNAIMNSSYWNNTVIFLSWDDWGSYYDHVVPPFVDATGYGPRVPVIAISPYTKPGYISHQQGEFASLLKFIEENWRLQSLGQRDSLASTGDMMDYFDFTQKPLQPLLMTPIPFSQEIALGERNNSLGTGLIGAINPLIGSPATQFVYAVDWMTPTQPVTHNVTIDGTAFPMTLTGTGSQGISHYAYTTTLPLGSHSYGFVFSDGTMTTTLPYNNGGVFPGPSVSPFTIDSPGISPLVGLPGSSFTYTVRYSSTTNTPPILADVDIDGAPFPMTSTGGTDYVNGVTYAYSTSTLALGGHYFRFRFDDGSGPEILEVGTDPSVSDVTLTGSGVSATTGTTSTKFTFSTTYTSSTGLAPTASQVYVDTTAYTLHKVSGTFASGAQYIGTTTLPAGNHTFYFAFKNSVSSWADPLAPATYAGPNVGTDVAPAPPSSLFEVPTHDQDTDFNLVASQPDN